MNWVDHIDGQTYHGRHGKVQNAFTYSVDYLLLDPETSRGPWLFSRNRANLTSLQDRDHGGPKGAGRGVAWAREVLAEHGLDQAQGQILLLAQPRLLGHVFNPVSFWLCHDTDGALRAVIAEVSNTFGDRHSYLCHHADQRPIAPQDTLEARKIFHVSPFQPIAGGYRFNFEITAKKIDIRIDFRHGQERLVATLAGPRRPLSNRIVILAALRRPFGARRVLGLIHWQAFKLWWKGAPWHVRPEPPREEITR
ncbi:MAG: DUF1365 domain-containing protein [Mangrovicoccus sp.]|nr:DUF1365 domain-containing protein [Mangrovicoccus sp.]